MATTFQTTDIVNGTLNISSGDVAYIMPGVQVFDDNASAVNMLSGTGESMLVNYGTVISGQSTTTIAMGSDISTVVNHGTISNTTVSVFGSAMLFAGGNSASAVPLTQVVINSGLIESRSAIFDFFSENGPMDVRVENSGDIVCHQRGDLFTSVSISNQKDMELINSGLIRAGDLDMSGGGYALVENSGTMDIERIEGTASNGFFLTNSGRITVRVGVFNTDIDGSNVSDQVTNSATGEIFGDLDLQTGNDSVSNEGLIRGQVELDEGADIYESVGGMLIGDLSGSDNNTVFNAGSILGNVTFSSGIDQVTNRGLIDGTVTLGTGADVFKGFGGTVTGPISAGGGNDTIYVDQADAAIDGGADFDVLFARSDVLNAINVEEIYLRGAGDFTALGDSATTLMIGNGGSNSLIGGANAAIMLGGAGDDVVEGAAGDDTLRGNGGNDELLGDEDADRLFGGTGDDTLTGGAGQDNLRGDQGADVFVYNATSESVAGNDRDIIIGFERGTDLIDVTGIGQDAFTFVGTSGFSGGGGLELGYRVVGGGTQVIVEMDENGDGIADAEIRVRGVGELDAGDFVL